MINKQMNMLIFRHQQYNNLTKKELKQLVDLLIVDAQEYEHVKNCETCLDTIGVNDQ